MSRPRLSTLTALSSPAPVLLVAVAALFLPTALALAALGLGCWLWWRRWGERRALLVGLLLTAAVAALALDLADRLRHPAAAVLEAEVSRRWDELWRELDEEAAAGAGLDLDEAEGGLPLSAFESLAARAEQAATRTTYLLLDPDGLVVAWAGEGLLHELEEALPGRRFRAGFTSITLASVHALDDRARPWRLLAGRSFPAEDLPFTRRGLGPVGWTVIGEDEEAPTDLTLLGSGPPWAAVRAGAIEAAAAAWTPSPARRRFAAACVALALLAAALLRLLALERKRLPDAEMALLLGAAIAAGRLFAVEAWWMLLLISASLFAGLSWRRPAAAGAPAPLVGTVAGLVPLLAAAGVQASSGPLHLGGEVAPGAPAVALRLALFALVFGVFGWVRRAPADGEGGLGRASGLAWAALVALLAAAAGVDRPVAGALLLLAGAALAAAWLSRQGRSARPAWAAMLVVLSSLVAAAGWEIAHRLALKRHLEQRLLAETAWPSAPEREEIARRTWGFFRGLDLGSVALKDPAALDLQDMALAVWKSSPLPRRGALSAVVVQSWDGRRASFSFGLPLDEAGDLDRSPVRGQQLPPPELLRRSLIEGAAALELDGRPWGFVRYWLLLRPGFRSSFEPIEELAVGLLRGGPSAVQPPRGLFEPARLAVYPGAATMPLEPFADGPARDELEPGGRTRVRAAGGRALALAAEDEDGARALLLPLLEPGAAVEQVTTHAFGTLLVGAALAAGVVLLSLRRALAGLRRASRYYSKRLLLVAAAFILVPILVLNFFLLRVLGERLEREQQAAGRAALESAQRILGEYVLALDTGFVIETTLDDELLYWLSRVVRHEVNLYWESEVYTSSRRELFTAGLLPKRIPGEIHSRLALGRARSASRIGRAGSTDYLEFYQPVSVPGVALDRIWLVASVPLLAQQEELAEEIAALRRRAFLATTALALLLAAVGSQLARGFTVPLMEVVAGTQRIAAGARSMGLRPSELELARLVEAIDRMAERIARGRQELVREKNLVESMIDNVASGVVSVDASRRVLMANRVAQRLLEARVGESLSDALAASDGLAPVADFLGAAGDAALQRTVQLAVDGDEREWSLVWAPLPGEGEPTALLVVEDVTEVLRSQRLQAWAEMARIIAHEIKNPLTPIRLSAEHMREVHGSDPAAFDEVFERCTRNILHQVAELQAISSEFLDYSRMSRCEPVPGELGALVEKILEGYRAAPPPGVELVLRPADGPIRALFDPKLLGRALRNLVENALRATAGGGRVEVSVRRDGDRAWIVVADDGPGVAPAKLGRIFEPYFSTHDTGTGLGLPIAQRIAEEHGGSVRAANRPGGGLEVAISLPLG